MSSHLHISMDEGTGAGGGGPDDDSRFPDRQLRSHGFLAIAFGFALGLSFMLFFWILRYVQGLPSKLTVWITKVHPNLWYTFLIGFIAGTLISAIYNFLIFRRLNLFGLDRNVN